MKFLPLACCCLLSAFPTAFTCRQRCSIAGVHRPSHCSGTVHSNSNVQSSEIAVRGEALNEKCSPGILFLLLRPPGRRRLNTPHFLLGSILAASYSLLDDTMASMYGRKPGFQRGKSSTFVNGASVSNNIIPGEQTGRNEVLLELADGSVYKGFGFGATGKSVSGECVFQTGPLSSLSLCPSGAHVAGFTDASSDN